MSFGYFYAGEREGRLYSLMTGQLGSQMKSRLEFDIACGHGQVLLKAWGPTTYHRLSCACLVPPHCSLRNIVRQACKISPHLIKVKPLWPGTRLNDIRTFLSNNGWHRDESKVTYAVTEV